MNDDDNKRHATAEASVSMGGHQIHFVRYTNGDVEYRIVLRTVCNLTGGPVPLQRIKDFQEGLDVFLEGPLGRIRAALEARDQALRDRKHGGVADGALVDAVREALNAPPWEENGKKP